MCGLMRFGRRVGPKARPDGVPGHLAVVGNGFCGDVGHHAFRGKFVHLTQRYHGHAKYVFT